MKNEIVGIPTPSKKRTIMARLATVQKKMFLTPAQSQAHVQAQMALVKEGFALQRQALRNAIENLCEVKMKPAKNVFEVKLVISRETLETCIGENAAVELAVAIAKKIIERHRALKSNVKEEQKV